ncbi:hypothetical protein SAMN05660284_02670 [Formivibrio citricus]|uniref:Uncharacterized protein n=1 Tax=Formivibrio citricus TaxID=83765 RepID=A0A1I5DIC6_9NEIS|nr:hypothetical protein SAMN05660284_02670 [Formivibrio citricus]
MPSYAVYRPEEPILKPRNPVACSPPLKKGGAHVKTEKRKRQMQKRELKTELAAIKSKGRCDFHSGLCF